MLAMGVSVSRLPYFEGSIHIVSIIFKSISVDSNSRDNLITSVEIQK